MIALPLVHGEEEPVCWNCGSPELDEVCTDCGVSVEEYLG